MQCFMLTNRNFCFHVFILLFAAWSMPYHKHFEGCKLFVVAVDFGPVHHEIISKHSMAGCILWF